MIAAALAVVVSAAWAEESPVRVEVADAMGAPGATVPVAVHFIIPPGTHIYADMIDVQVAEADGLTVGALDEPAGKLVADPANPAKQRETYEAGDTAVQLPVTLPKDGDGSYDLKLTVRHQACRVGLCFPPATDELVAHVGTGGIPAVPGIGAASAATPEEEEVAADFSAGTPTPGTLAVHVDLHGEWHINKMFVNVTVTNPAEGYTVGDLVLPTPVPSGSEADGTWREDFKRDFNIVAPVTGKEGPVELTVDVGYQACKGVSLCRMPTTASVKVPVTVLAAGVVPALPSPDSLYTEPEKVEAAAAPPAAAPAEAAAVAAEGDAEEGSFAAAAKRGYAFLLGFCFLTGIAMSFTPCVLPMVPINMGIIGARGASSRAEAFSLASSYVLGQTMLYTVLGVGAALSGALFGSWLQNPYVLGSIGIVFIALGFSMFGFFDLQVPSFIQNRVSGFDKRGGFAVAFIFGMIGGLLAGPCTGPVVVAILGVIAAGSSGAGTDWMAVAKGAGLMGVFAFGMGQIFLVSGAAAGWMPKRGAYMTTVKKSFGVVMWLGAIYFTKSMFTTVQTALATSAVLLVTGVFAWPDPEDGEGFYTQRLRQLYTITAVIVGGWLLIATLITQGFIYPKLALGAGEGSATVAASGAKIAWLTSEAEGLAASQAAGGKPLMIDFTAEWCAACHELEQETYPDPAVIAAAGDFVPVMVDCTNESSPEIKALQEKYAVKGLPTVVWVMPDGRELARINGFTPPEEFVQILAKAKAKAG